MPGKIQLDPRTGTMYCAQCGDQRPMPRHNNALSAVLAAEYWQTKHRCVRVRPQQQPKPKQKPVDRWQQLFAAAAAR